MENPKVSVVIPTFNEEKNIEKAIASLMFQDYENFEVIIVDDVRSNDNARKKIVDLCTKYKNLRYFVSRTSGPGAARNIGMRNAKGEIIAFIDADCAAEKNWISTIVDDMKSTTISGIGGTEIVEGDIFADFIQYETNRRRGSRFCRADFLPSCNVAVWKSVLEDVNGFDDSFISEDDDLCYRLVERNYKLFYDPKMIVKHGEGVTSLSFIKKYFEKGYWYAYFMTRYPKKGMAGDWSKGVEFMLQPIALTLFILSFLLFVALRIDWLKYAIVLFASLYVVSGIVFLKPAFRGNNVVRFLVFFFLNALRNALYALGGLYGSFSLIFKKARGS